MYESGVLTWEIVLVTDIHFLCSVLVRLIDSTSHPLKPVDHIFFTLLSIARFISKF